MYHPNDPNDASKAWEVYPLEVYHPKDPPGPDEGEDEFYDDDALINR